MKTTFLGQGFDSKSVDAIGNYLIQYLNRADFHSFTGISAFASEAGIYGLSGHIKLAKSVFKNITLIVGIDQDGTSKEALEEILNLNIDSYIFYQNEAPIFHPKIYLFEGDIEIKLIVGSSNLTARGLFSNVESSLLIEFDFDDKDGVALLNSLKTYYKTLFDFSDKNLFKISQAVIDEFNAKGIVPDESERKKIYRKKNIATPSGISKSISINIPKRETAKIPTTKFPSKLRSKIKESSNLLPNLKITQTTNQNPISSKVPTISTPKGILVWESGPLSERDLNIPKGKKTNNTGSMLIKKGLLKNIDQRHYFRDVVFASLNWAKDINPKKAHFERAIAKFRIKVEGLDYGVFDLTLSHNNNTEQESYIQKQPMTNLSWGKAKKIVAREELLGKSAKILEMNSNGEFTLEIE